MQKKSNDGRPGSKSVWRVAVFKDQSSSFADAATEGRRPVKPSQGESRQYPSAPRCQRDTDIKSRLNLPYKNRKQRV